MLQGFIAMLLLGVRALNTTPVTDQNDTLQCWAVAATSRFDVAVAENVGHLVKLSARYSFYTKTRAEVIEHLLRKDFKLYRGQLCEGCPLEPVYYEQGGVYADAVEAAKRFGVLPEEAYPGFPQSDTELFRRLNALIAEVQGRPGQPDQAEVVGRVTALLDQYVGAPPASFEFEGRRFDARGFFAAVLPGWQEAPALELNFHPGSRERRTTVAAFDGARYPALQTGQHARVMSLLERSLRAQRAVLIQYKVIDEEHTQRDGHIGFAINGLPVPRHVDWDSPLVLDHYVLAIGARYSDDGRLLAVLVKNTWGTSPRENYGFHWLESDYFRLIEGVEVPAGIEP
jgi:hypothetical protein